MVAASAGLVAPAAADPHLKLGVGHLEREDVSDFLSGLGEHLVERRAGRDFDSAR